MLSAWGWIMSNWLIRIIHSVIAFGIPFALCAAFLSLILMVRTRRRRRRVGRRGRRGGPRGRCHVLDRRRAGLHRGPDTLRLGRLGAPRGSDELLVDRDLRP